MKLLLLLLAIAFTTAISAQTFTNADLVKSKYKPRFDSLKKASVHNDSMYYYSITQRDGFLKARNRDQANYWSEQVQIYERIGNDLHFRWQALSQQFNTDISKATSH